MIKKRKTPPPRLYRVIIQKPVIGQRSTEERLAARRRVVIVDADTVDRGAEYLRETLERTGAFLQTTGEILRVEPAPDCVILST